MGQTLDALHRLQVVEKNLAGIRGDRAIKLRRVEGQQARIEKADKQHAEVRSKSQTAQIRLDALQLDIAAREESVVKHRAALNQAKTNKEYAAILTAMNTEKADNSKIETDVLELMQEVQDRSDEAKAIEEDRTNAEEGVAKAQAALDAFDNRVRDRQEALRAEREECAHNIDPSTLATFTRVAEHHDGEAMVSIQKLHPRRPDYMCGGCNVMITLEVMNTLQSRDEIQNCSACGRILFLEDKSKQGTRA